MLRRADPGGLADICFVYRLVFAGGGIYTGITKRPKQRLAEHIYESTRGSDLPVHRAIRKHGIPEQKILLVGKREYCQKVEISLIAKEKGYNASTGGEVAPTLGMRASESTRRKMSDSHKGKKQCPEWVSKRTSTQIGKNRSAESRKKMSDGQKIRIRTDEEISRMSEMAKQRKSTPEWREKLSRAAKLRHERARENKSAEPILKD